MASALLESPKGRKSQLLTAAISVLGIALMGYLAYLKISAGQSSFCDLAEGISCSAVNQSVFSEFLGVPVAVLGILYFAFVLTAVLTGFAGKLTYPLIVLATAASLIFSLYLTYAEIFILKTICILCEASKVLMLVIGGLALRQARAFKSPLRPAWIIGAVLIGAAGIGVSSLSQRGLLPKENYDSFAQCLTEKGWAMYGTFWCPNCGRQKLMFGDSFAFIEDVECDPRGDNPQTDRCLIRSIEKTPTWIRESEDNETEFERLVGLQPMEKLSEDSGCPLKAGGENSIP